MSHNVCTLDGENQWVAGTAKVERWRTTRAEGSAVIRFKGAYRDVASAARGVRIIRSMPAVLVQDEFVLKDKRTLVWGMTTKASIDVSRRRTAVLSQDGKTLFARMLAPEDARFEVGSAERKPPDRDNKGFRRLLIKIAEATGTQRIAVLFMPHHPNARPVGRMELTPLASWPDRRDEPASKKKRTVAGRRKPVGPRALRERPTPKALREWDATLLKRLREHLASGARVRVHLRSLRSTVRILSVDEGGSIRITAGPVRTKISGGQLPPSEKGTIAGSVAEKGTARDHLMAAFYFRAAGDAERAGRHLAGAGRLATTIDRYFEKAAGPSR
jgi:hypothetical protein